MIIWSKKHSHHLSTRIRGKEISKFISVEPTIYIKPSNLDDVKDGWWVDVLDGGKFLKKLKLRPKIKLIACTKTSYDYLKERFSNEIVLIPHQHINWERNIRNNKEVTTCGYIGSPSPIAREIYAKIGKEINKIGFDFDTLFRLKNRMDAVNFYKNIDILVIGAWELGDLHIHKIPTKIINAASFGIPTVAYPMKGYKEIEGYYTHASNMKELVSEVSKFKDPSYYEEKTKGLIEMSEKYHISNIAKLYQKL